MALMKRSTPISTNSPSGWWYSTDGRRGFCLAAVKGFDYRPTSEGRMASALYIYIESGVYHLSGAEADTVYTLIKGKEKK